MATARAAENVPGLSAWIVYNLFGAFYPTLIMLACMVAVASGFSDIEQVRIAIGQVPFFSVLPVVGFSLLLTVAGDLIFEGRSPGHWWIIILIITGALLTPLVGIASYLEAHEKATGVQVQDSGIWAAVEAITFLVCIIIVAVLKSESFTQAALERALAEAESAQDNDG